MMRVRYVFTLLVTVFISMCAASAHAEKYHIYAGSSSKGLQEDEKQNVHLGFASVLNEALSQEDMHCTIKSYNNVAELVTAIKKKEINAFFGSPVEFFELEPYLLKKPIASLYFGSKRFSRIFLIVRKDSGYHQLEDLKGKKLAIKKWYAGDIASYYLDTMLMERKLPTVDSFFSEVEESETTNRAVVDLFFNKVDAALVTEHQFKIATRLNPQLENNTRVLLASEPYALFLVAMGKDTPTEYIYPIMTRFFETGEKAKGKAILRIMKIGGFHKIDISQLENMRKLMDRYKTLKAQQSGK